MERLLALGRELGRRRSLRDPVGGSIADTAGLTPPQIHSLLWLGQEQPMPMGVLARRLGVTEKSVTGTVDRLEAAGLVIRKRDPHDRRVVTVSLSDKGSELAAGFEEEVRHKAAWLLSLLDEADRAALFRILENVRDRLGPDEPGAGSTEAP